MEYLYPPELIHPVHSFVRSFSDPARRLHAAGFVCVCESGQVCLSGVDGVRSFVRVAVLRVVLCFCSRCFGSGSRVCVLSEVDVKMLRC